MEFETRVVGKIGCRLIENCKGMATELSQGRIQWDLCTNHLFTDTFSTPKTCDYNHSISPVSAEKWCLPGNVQSTFRELREGGHLLYFYVSDRWNPYKYHKSWLQGCPVRTKTLEHSAVKGLATELFWSWLTETSITEHNFSIPGQF